MKPAWLWYVLLMVLATGSVAAQSNQGSKPIADSLNKQADKLKAKTADHLKNVAVPSAELQLELKTDGQAKSAFSSTGQQTKSVVQSLSPIKKGNKISFNLSAELQNRYNASQPVTAGASVMNNLLLTGGVVLWGIPLETSYATNPAYGNTARGADHLFKFNLDKGWYGNLIRSPLEKYTSLKTQLSGMNVSSFTRNRVAEKISQLKQSGQELEGTVLNGYLQDTKHVNELLKLDERQLKEKLYALAKTKVNTGKQQLSATIKSKKAPTAAQLENNVRTQVDSISGVISRVKGMIARNGIVLDSLLSIEQQVATGNFSPEMINRFIPQNMMQKSFANRVFSAINDFKAGSFGTTIPGAQISPAVFVQGFRLGLSKKFNGLALGYGRVNELGFMKDGGFQSSVYGTAKDLAFVSVKTNSSLFLNGRLSWLNSINRKSESGVAESGALPRSNTAFTFTQAVNLNRGGDLSFDISKSFAHYRNTLSPGLDQIMQSRNSLGYYLGDEMLQTMAVGVTHSMDLRNAGLSDQFYFNIGGSGYQNPASNGFNAPKTRMGGNIKKRLFRNKLALNLRTDLQTTPMGPQNAGKWSNYQFQLDSRYQSGKKYTVSLKYMADGSDQLTDNLRKPVYHSQKFQADANASYALGNWFGVSHLSISNQNLANTYVTAIQSNMMMVNYSQAIVIGGNTITGNLFYNKELSDYKLIGDMVNSDLSMQYMLLKNIGASTAVTYLYNQDVAKQTGVRQTFQYTAGEHFDLNMYMDMRKNIIRPLYPELYSACRAELSIKYFFNTQKSK